MSRDDALRGLANRTACYKLSCDPAGSPLRPRHSAMRGAGVFIPSGPPCIIDDRVVNLDQSKEPSRQMDNRNPHHPAPPPETNSQMVEEVCGWHLRYGVALAEIAHRQGRSVAAVRADLAAGVREFMLYLRWEKAFEGVGLAGWPRAEPSRRLHRRPRRRGAGRPVARRAAARSSSSSDPDLADLPGGHWPLIQHFAALAVLNRARQVSA